MPYPKIFFIVGILFFFIACNSSSPLPILGERSGAPRVVDGKTIIDTIYKTIPHFRYRNQDSLYVDNTNFNGKIYVADFFFTSCPTICPIMEANMLKLAGQFKDDKNIFFVSYTIDPKHDSPHRLKEYAKKLGAEGLNWQFLTGDRDSTFTLAEKGYYATAKSDTTAPGGFVHSGGFILIDKQRRIRGIYDGTLEEDVNKLGKDLVILEKEKE